VQSLQQVLSEDAKPVADMDEFERNEDRELKRQWAKLRPVKAKLTNRRYLSAVLSGQAVTKPAIRRQLRDVLNRFADEDRGRLERGAGIEKTIMQGRQEKVHNLANEPERLMVLHRYANVIERSIRRLLAQLR
jgi:hypothetical protein